MRKKKDGTKYYCYISFNIFDKPLNVEDGGWAVKQTEAGINDDVEDEEIVELPFKEYQGNLEEIEQEISFDIHALTEHIKCVKKM